MGRQGCREPGPALLGSPAPADILPLLPTLPAGIWSEGADGTDINAVARSHNGKLLVSADDFGKVHLFSYPCCQPRVSASLGTWETGGSTGSKIQTALVQPHSLALVYTHRQTDRHSEFDPKDHSSLFSSSPLSSLSPSSFLPHFLLSLPLSLPLLCLSLSFLCRGSNPGHCAS